MSFYTSNIEEASICVLKIKIPRIRIWVWLIRCPRVRCGRWQGSELYCHNYANKHVTDTHCIFWGIMWGSQHTVTRSMGSKRKDTRHLVSVEWLQGMSLELTAVGEALCTPENGGFQSLETATGFCLRWLSGCSSSEKKAALLAV